MRKLALAAVVATLLLTHGPRPAEARCFSHCGWFPDALGWTLALGLVGGYAGGTGYFIYRDATDEQQSLDYAVTELSFNGLLGALFAGGTVESIKHHSVGGTLAFGALTLTHGALAAHAVWRMSEHRDEIRVEDRTLAAFGAVAYAANSLMWALQLPDRHGRTYGVAELAVNAPIAAGLGYVAIDRAQRGDTRYAMLFGGMAAVSGALAVHGLRTALRPTNQPEAELDFGLDLGRGATIAPTVVSDGKDVAPGLGASGAW
jgi:hypothetical protein